MATTGTDAFAERHGASWRAETCEEDWDEGFGAYYRSGTSLIPEKGTEEIVGIWDGGEFCEQAREWMNAHCPPIFGCALAGLIRRTLPDVMDRAWSPHDDGMPPEAWVEIAHRNKGEWAPEIDEFEVKS